MAEENKTPETKGDWIALVARERALEKQMDEMLAEREKLTDALAQAEARLAAARLAAERVSATAAEAGGSPAYKLAHFLLRIRHSLFSRHPARFFAWLRGQDGEFHWNYLLRILQGTEKLHGEFDKSGQQLQRCARIVDTAVSAPPHPSLSAAGEAFTRRAEQTLAALYRVIDDAAGRICLWPVESGEAVSASAAGITVLYLDPGCETVQPSGGNAYRVPAALALFAAARTLDDGAHGALCIRETMLNATDAGALAKTCDFVLLYLNGAEGLSAASREFLQANPQSVAVAAGEQQRVEAAALIGDAHVFPLSTGADCGKQLLQYAFAGYCKKTVLVFAPISWDYRIQRPQQLARCLAQRGCRVVYVNADFGGQTAESTRGRVHVLSLQRPEGAPESVYAIDDEMARALTVQLSDYGQKAGLQNAVMLVEYPSWQPVAAALQKEFGFSMVFDCLDEYAGFPGAQGARLARWTQLLTQQSNCCVATSTYLARRLNGQPEPVLIQNGTQFTHFYSACHPQKRTGNARPVIGYYGAIAQWFDGELVAAVAEKLPEYDFVLAGLVQDGADAPLQGVANITLTGEIAYQALPELLATFDVCLIPFRATLELIQATNPVKFYEYLSAGKKVVSTVIPELAPYAGRFVRMENQPEPFAAAIRACVQGTDGLADANECVKFARGSDWLARADVLIQQL